MSAANEDRPAFVCSPHAYRYFSAGDLRQLLVADGFRTEVFGAFPSQKQTLNGRLVSLAHRVVVGVNLVPGSLRGRDVLKRLAYGRLQPLPAEVSGDLAGRAPLAPMPGTGPAPEFKVLHAIGRVP